MPFRQFWHFSPFWYFAPIPANLVFVELRVGISWKILNQFIQILKWWSEWRVFSMHQDTDIHWNPLGPQILRPFPLLPPASYNLPAIEISSNLCKLGHCKFQPLTTILCKSPPASRAANSCKHLLRIETSMQIEAGKELNKAPESWPSGGRCSMPPWPNSRGRKKSQPPPNWHNPL